MTCLRTCFRAELGGHDPLWEARARIERLEALLRTCRELLPQHHVQIIDAIDDATGLNAALSGKEGP